MTNNILQKTLAKMAELAGNWFVDVSKFTFCALVLSSLFNNMSKTWVTYTAFIVGGTLCFIAGAFFLRNKNNDK
jgi:hypothetical protein